ncbi:hypothetical protein FNV43_RR04715 [Rhamnella rubrinervis]|uniref:Cytochrome b561 domain-containing protein n=1 Tax=Rhamnella rubrinervis TaxID=2594499 RepID=A0A8K0MQI8_9ROSA|nr:hypothetical protein FNV43_RR04715 [Rhamnella rubrinervis]
MALPLPVPCTNHKFPEGKSFVACKDLTLLNSFLHWNYYPSSATVEIAFRQIGETNSNSNPSYGTELQKGNLSFPVHDISVASDGNEIVIFATIKLPNNSTVVNHLWQQGPVLPGNCLAYVIGVAGWGTGIWLGRKSSGVEYKGHECIGCTLFALATIQVVVGRFFRPNKEHKKRIYWELFHYAVGYGTVILGIINIYKGLDILEPGKSVWRTAYTVIIIALWCIAAVLEAITWILVWIRKKAPVEVEAGCVAEDGISSPTGRVTIA